MWHDWLRDWFASEHAAILIETLSRRLGFVQNGAELASALCARLPAKIDIGPVYSVDPQQRKTLGGEWHESHLP